MSQRSFPSPKCMIRIRCLLPSRWSQPISSIVTPDTNSPMMTSTTKTFSSNSFGFPSTKTSTVQNTCNLCKRLLYPFEEILLCSVCHNSYHWRCVKPDMSTHHGINQNFVCEKCNVDRTIISSSPHRTINSSSPHRITNGNMSTFPTDYRDSINLSTDSNRLPTNRYFEETPRQTRTDKTIKVSDLSSYLPSSSNENNYQLRDSQYNDDSRTTRRIQQQQQHQNGLETDEEHDLSNMFEAKYQYTPLKDFAAMRTNRTINDNSYQNSPSDNSTRPTTSRYGGGLQYLNHGYDPTVSRAVEAPSSANTHFSSPSVDNLPIQTRPELPQQQQQQQQKLRNFVSTTNLNVNDKPAHRSQRLPQNSLVQSTSFLSQIRDHDSPVFRSLVQKQQEQQQESQQQTDRQSFAGSDSGIATTNSNPPPQSQPSKHSDENQSVDKKLTDLVQRLGKQLENDAQKVNEKLELKLKNLETMINQQTYVIRRQDEVIERLKSKILKIESERDHFRDRLNAHEQDEDKDDDEEEKKPSSNNETGRFDEQDNQNERYHASTSAATSTTDNSKPSTKKTPAPRVDHQPVTSSEENRPPVSKLANSNPLNHQQLPSDSSSVPLTARKLASSVPVIENSAASSRLDNMIHQSTTKDSINPSSSNYNLASLRHQNRKHNPEPVSMEQQVMVSTVHHEDEENDKSENSRKSRRSSSSSSSSHVYRSPSPPKPKVNQLSTNNTTTSIPSRNSNIHRSFESLQNRYQSDQGLKTNNKTASLEFGTRPVRYDDPGSIYIQPTEGTQSALQSDSIVKGWLRKQNRDSFLKRIERYYCILTNNALLLHRRAEDRIPHKAINLKGAKVLYYDDPKHGPSIELTWSGASKEPKHYHLYASNQHEAMQWVDGIQTTVHNLENSNDRWRQYRMNN